ncbi:MAG: protein kinase [Planctomycetia bacterium]|nr:protein kinase [Planctomycetia bacterium]
MSAASVGGLLGDLRRLQLLSAAQCEHLAGRGFADHTQLIQELLRRSWLTPFQAKQVVDGQAERLALGPYVVLDRLGEGGMGQVFKARHQRLDRLVALKVIRKDFVGDREAVGRFYREIQATSRLSHPHIIRAEDAGPLGEAHFLAMEYVQGIDLDRLVARSGPLPIDQACGYIYQATLGLQAIHELGLVHRDLKPSNLMLAQRERQRPEGIKILDLGLALLQESIHGKGTTRLPDGQSLTTLTLDGPATIGSVDYMAPEQALDFHRVDIRADIYSLGCTLFFLLTGKPPFGNCPLAVKLMRHQQAEPPELERFRADAPRGLSAVLRRMLAKRPADRYQTPADAAAALAPFVPRGLVAVAQAPGGSGRSWRALPGGSPLRWVALALLLVSMIGLLAWSWSGSSSSSAGVGRIVPNSRPMRNARLRDLPDNSWLRLGSYESNTYDREVSWCYDPKRQRLVRIGGRATKFSNEIAVYDLGAEAWQIVQPYTVNPNAASPGLGNRPGYSSFRGTCYDREHDCFWDYCQNQVGGGVGGLWRGDGLLQHWQHIKEVPGGAACRVAYDEHARKLVCLSYDGGSWGHTYIYDPHTRQVVNGAADPTGAQTGRAAMGPFYGFLYVPELKGCLLVGRAPDRFKKPGGPETVTWAFDPFTGTWRDLAPRGPVPSGRQEMGLSHDRKHGVVLLFGGKPGTESSAPHDDLWIYEPTRNTWTELKGPGSPRSHYRTRPPGGGDCQAFAYDEEHNVHVLILQGWGDKDSAIWVYRYQR